jgi:hypothetical protein
LKGTKINVLLDRLPLVSGSAGDHQVGEFQVTIPGGIRPSDGGGADLSFREKPGRIDGAMRHNRSVSCAAN